MDDARLERHPCRVALHERKEIRDPAGTDEFELPISGFLKNAACLGVTVELRAAMRKDFRTPGRTWDRDG